MKAPLPPNEADRLQALAEYRLMDSGFDDAYDEITRLLAQICDVPIALIGLIDRDRQWFKSVVGLNSSETPRNETFCAHAILKPGEMMVVSDATADPRFADNPAVTGEPGIRFYTGLPLNTPEGQPLGTFCMVDVKPRILTAEQARMLQVLGRQISRLFELHKTSRKLADALGKVKVLEEILPTCGHCKAIRDEQGNWHSLESYLDAKVNVSMSHGICPDCMKKHYPGYKASR